MDKTVIEQEAIIAEYLSSGTSFRKLEKKYGVDFRTIHSWVRKFNSKSLKKRKSTTTKPQSLNEESLPTEVKKLQAELRKTQLQAKLLNAIIDIAEKELNIEIRKKSGTKR